MVAALTPKVEVESQRNGSLWKQSFEFGIASGPAAQVPCGSETGTRITLIGLPPPSEADVDSLAAQCEVWRAANPALTIVIHERL
jgi:DNA gyrase/topoisomerase IV subunit B